MPRMPVEAAVGVEAATAAEHAADDSLHSDCRHALPSVCAFASAVSSAEALAVAEMLADQTCAPSAMMRAGEPPTVARAIVESMVTRTRKVTHPRKTMRSLAAGLQWSCSL
jgi:hypothetical protein